MIVKTMYDVMGMQDIEYTRSNYNEERLILKYLDGNIVLVKNSYLSALIYYYGLTIVLFLGFCFIVWFCLFPANVLKMLRNASAMALFFAKMQFQPS